MDAEKRVQRKKDGVQPKKKLKVKDQRNKDADLISQANQIALKTLVQRHEREFLRLREVARRNLGVVPQWRQVV